jgi:hypothetical protein
MDEVIGWLVAGVGKECGDCFEQRLPLVDLDSTCISVCEPAF